jgi:hypothetical protein
MTMAFQSRSSLAAGKRLAPLGLTPLMHAAQEGHADCVRLLLLAKASAHSEDEDGMNPLHHAASTASLDVAAVLIWAGAFPSAIDKSGLSVMGHLPPELHTDFDEMRRWRILLAQKPISLSLERERCTLEDKPRPMELPATPMKIHPISGFERSHSHDSMDYTRVALESMGPTVRQA